MNGAGGLIATQKVRNQFFVCLTVHTVALAHPLFQGCPPSAPRIEP